MKKEITVNREIASQAIRKQKNNPVNDVPTKRKGKKIFPVVGIVFVLFLIGVWVLSPLDAHTRGIDNKAVKDLMKQYIESEEPEYKGKLLDKWFADCRVLGAGKNGDAIDVYAYVYSGEYVKLKDKVYDISGSAVPVTLKCRFEGDKIKLNSVKEAMDGDYYMSSIKKMFSAKAYLNFRIRDGLPLYSGSGMNSGLEKEQIKRVAKEFGSKVFEDDILEIDEKNNYKVTHCYYGKDGEFQTELKEEGRLEPMRDMLYGTWKFIGTLEEGKEPSIKNAMVGKKYLENYDMEKMPDGKINIGENGIKEYERVPGIESVKLKKIDESRFKQTIKITSMDKKKLKEPFYEYTLFTLNDGYLFMEQSYSDKTYSGGNANVYKRIK